MATTTQEHAVTAKVAADIVLGIEGHEHSGGEKKRKREARSALLLRKPEKALAAMEGVQADVGANLKKLGEQFGLGRVDPDSGRIHGRSLEAQARFDRYDNALNDALAFVDLQRGFDKLSPEKQNAIQKQVKELLLRDRGTLGQAFAGLSDEARNAAVVKALQNPSLAKYIREGLVAQQAQQFSVGAEQYNGAVGQYRTHVATASARGGLETQVATNVASAEEILTEIRAGRPLTDGHRGPQLMETDEALGRLEAQIAKTELRRRNLMALPVSLDQQRELKTILEDQSRYANQIANIRIANQEKLPSVSDAEDRNIKRRQELIDVQRNNRTELTQQDVLWENLHHALTQRVIEEESMASNMEGVISQAVYKQLLTDQQNAMKILQEQESEIAAEERKAIIEGLVSNIENTRWRKKVMRKRGFFRRKREELLVNTEKVDQDFNLLLKRGPDVLLRRVLRGVRTHGEGGFPQTLSTHQIDELMEDHDFVHKWGHAVAEQAMAQRSLFRQYRPSEIHHFMNTSWGKEMLMHAYRSNEEYRAQLGALGDAGEVDFYDPSFRNKFAQAASQNPALLFFPRTTLRWAIPSAAQVVDRPQALAA